MNKARKFQTFMLIVLIVVGILQFFDTPKILDYVLGVAALGFGVAVFSTRRNVKPLLFDDLITAMLPRHVRCFCRSLIISTYNSYRKIAAVILCSVIFVIGPFPF